MRVRGVNKESIQSVFQVLGEACEELNTHNDVAGDSFRGMGSMSVRGRSGRPL